MLFDDEYDWHAPHPSDRATLRDRLVTGLGLLLVAIVFAWGLSGYPALWDRAAQCFPTADRPAAS